MIITPLPIIQTTIAIADIVSIGILVSDGIIGGSKMGLFGSFFKPIKTKSVDIPDGLMEFLNEVDALYMQAYQLKSTRNVAKFLTREAACRLQSAVCSMNCRYFGDAKFRNTKWTKEKEDGNITILKEVTFDNVHIAGNLSISVASPYKERWVISREGNCYKVSIISSVA